MFYDNFVALCASANKTPAHVGRELGIDKSTISCWKARKTNPSDVNAKKIANYFGVTVEELMADGPSAGIKKETTELLDDLKNFSVLYKKLTEENKKKADEYIALLLGSQK